MDEKHSKSTDNRSNILACALRLFASYGYDSVGDQTIVETAGVTKPTLYYYFKSKRGLLKALLEEHFERLYTMLKPATAYHGDLSLSLNSVTTAYFHLAREHPDFFRLQASLYFAPPEHEGHKMAIRFQEREFGLVKKLFVRAVKDYRDLKGHEDYCTATFMGMVDNWTSLALNGYAELDSTLVHQTVHQFLYGIFSK